MRLKALELRLWSLGCTRSILGSEIKNLRFGV